MLIPRPSPRRRHRTREFNPCHHPGGTAVGGQFASKGVGDCAPDRTVYGSSTDDPHHPALQFQQVTKEMDVDGPQAFARMNDQIATTLDKNPGYLSAEDLKGYVAKGIGARLAAAPVPDADLSAIVDGLGVQRRYRTTELVPNNVLDPDSTQAQQQYQAALDQIPDADTAQQEYDELEDPEPEHPDPDDLQDEYDEYRDEAESEQSDQQQQAYLDEAPAEWERAVDEAIEKTNGFLDDARDAITDIVPEASPYGDTSGHPELFADIDRKPASLNLYPTQLEVAAAQYRMQEDGTVPFFADPRWIAAGGTIPDDLPDAATLSEKNQAEIYQFIEEESEETWREHYADRFETDDSSMDIDDFDNWYKEKEGVWPADWNTESKPDFETWFRDQYGVDPGEEPTFDEWYQTKSGVSVVMGRNYAIVAAAAKANGGTPFDRDGTASDLASHLVHVWAETSSDTHPLAIAMQEEARDLFKLGTTNHEAYENRLKNIEQSLSGMGRADTREKIARYRQDYGPTLRAFLQSAYDETQARFAEAGYKPDDYLTLFRGMKEASGDFSTVSRQGDLVDVLLQPMSSYSTSLQQANNFAGAHLLVTRVPVKAILGTPFSAYGCYSENEFVVLGGRYTTVYMKPTSIYPDVQTAITHALRRGTRRVDAP